MPLETLAPYFRGARFAVVALRRRHSDAPGLDADAERYIGLVDQYSAAAVATFKLKQAREQEAQNR